MKGAMTKKDFIILRRLIMSYARTSCLIFPGQNCDMKSLWMMSWLILYGKKVNNYIGVVPFQSF